jgi:hypothetical protein
MDWITANTHHLLLGLLLLLGLGIAALCVTFIRHGRDPLRPVVGTQKEKSDWLLGSAFVVIILAGNSWLDNRDAKIHAQISAQRALVMAGYVPDEHARFDVNLNQCPPQSPGMTDQVLMVIATQADGKHVVTGCSRIAHRMFQVRG